MIQENEVQFPLMHWKLEEQGGTHPPSWSLEVPLPTPVGHVSSQAAKSGCEYLHASHPQLSAARSPEQEKWRVYFGLEFTGKHSSKEQAW